MNQSGKTKGLYTDEYEPPHLRRLAQRIQSAEGTVIHASLPFFSLVENRPNYDQPNWVEIACFKRNNNGEGILAYLSLVDAELDRQIFNRDEFFPGTEYEFSDLRKSSEILFWEIK